MPDNAAEGLSDLAQDLMAKAGNTSSAATEQHAHPSMRWVATALNTLQYSDLSRWSMQIFALQIMQIMHVSEGS